MGLFIQPVKQISTHTQLLYNVNFIRTLIDLFEAHNIGMIELTHDKNLVPQLPQALGRVNQTDIQAFDGILNARGSMDHQPYHSRNTRTQYRTIMNTRVNLFNRFAKRSLQRV
jgi:hypothetical protein